MSWVKLLLKYLPWLISESLKYVRNYKQRTRASDAIDAIDLDRVREQSTRREE